MTFTYSCDPGCVIERMKEKRFDSLNAYDHRIAAERIMLFEGFDSLLCLDTISGIEKFWYQIETVKRVLKHYRGRVLLCDEVGLGKTIEAGMIVKEYVLRGMIRTILILVPPSLISQWKEEMAEKFGLDFATTEEISTGDEPESFWKENDRIIASIHRAKSKKNFESVVGRHFDMVIVDEAHHVKNRNTINWKLVNELKKRFILLLTATPVQNDLMELHNLITLLSPGTLSTAAQFKKEFVEQGNPRIPRHREKLRDLLSQVMIRNTRSLVEITLPPRYATTCIVEMSPSGQELYQKVSTLARAIYPLSPAFRMVAATLMSEAGSSPACLIPTLEKLRNDHSFRDHSSLIMEAIALAQRIPRTEKALKLLDLVQQNRAKKLIFTRYTATLQYLSDLFAEEGMESASFHGGLSAAEKERQIKKFEHETDILISTEAGGEGRNLQFCAAMFNFDLPWNPMKIEQRIGRIHRIGQTKDVFIFNLSTRGTLEDHILTILDRKIHMFELVIGEIGMILGNLTTEKEFPDLIMELWATSADDEEARKNLDRLGEEIVEAKKQYLNTKEIDSAIFAADYET